MSPSGHILQELGSIHGVKFVVADTLGRHDIPTAVGILQTDAGRAAAGDVAPLQRHGEDLKAHT